MTRSVSDGAIELRVGVVIPLRSLRGGKLRLRHVLDVDERQRLIESMAETVVRACHDLPAVIVFDDPEVLEWASARELAAIRGRVPGLDAAVALGCAHFADAGFTHVIVAHADLPRARDLRPVADFDGVTVVPDRLGDGTNVLCVPLGIGFTFAYGPGSFENHLRIAERCGVPVRVLDDAELAWDVDHPDDLLPGDHLPGDVTADTRLPTVERS